MSNLKGEKELLIKLLEEVFGSSIQDIEFEDTEEFDTIVEYNFSIIKIKVYYKDERKEELYLKMIKGGKIKESIFCYWSILYEEYLRSNRDNKEDVIKKAIITQITSNENSSCIVLTLNAELNYCAEINLIELKNLVEKNKEIKRWFDKNRIKGDEILFIGKKLY